MAMLLGDSLYSNSNEGEGLLLAQPFLIRSQSPYGLIMAAADTMTIDKEVAKATPTPK